MSERSPDLSVVVACFDEEEALPLLFEELARLLTLIGERGLRAEILFVDDGSGDATPGQLRDWCDGRDGARALTHPENRGFGAAMRTGFSEAAGRAVVCYDADCTYPIDDVLRLLDALDDADVAGASPFSEGGTVSAGPVRRALSRGAAGLYRLALRERGLGITVYTCAFRAYRAEVLRGLTWESDDFGAAAEVLVRLLLRGARVVEVPSALSERAAGRSKMRFGRTTARHLRLVTRAALRAGGFTSGGRDPDGAPPESIADRNARLNREWPMERIERHPRRAVREAEARRRREVLDLLRADPGDLVLDVGSGRGAYARRLAAAGAKPVALDLDPAELSGQSAPCVAADAAALPFADRSVDGIVLAEVLEHCPAPPAVLEEAVRVLRVGGRLSLSVPDDARILAVKRFLKGLGLTGVLAGLPEDLAPGHLHVFDANTLRRLLGAAGNVVSFRRDLASVAFLAAVTRREGGR